MAVGIPVPHLQFEENRRQEEEDQSLDEAHQQLNRQKREYAQGAEDGSEHVSHGVNDRFPGVNVAVKTGRQRNRTDRNAQDVHQPHEDK